MQIKHYFLTISVFASTLMLADEVETFDVMPDTWVCMDDLGRNVASSDRGITRLKKDVTCQVGIFYYLWHGQHGAETKDITRLLQADPDNPKWGGKGAFHWGSKPALGYYTGGTPYIVARHMQMLMDAGIDFYFFDVTNAFTYDDQVRVVMKEIDRREKLGLKTPKLVFTCHSSSASTVTKLYNTWYSKPANDKYWFMWEKKPLILVESGTEASLAENIRQHFTFRYCWAWDTGEKKWPWLANYPQEACVKTSGGQKVQEQISVSAAQHPYSKMGKSYTFADGRKQRKFDKYGLCVETPRGLYLQEQFNRALQVHPQVLMITQWNEWMAQRFLIENSDQYGFVRPGGTAKVGETYFVDVYNQEFSRDIEPSADSLIRDNYYLLMTSNIRKYRGVTRIPVPVVSKSIDLQGDYSQWDDVTPEFRDEPGDTYYISSTAQNVETRRRKAVDIVKAKVTKDEEYLYFYVEAAADIPQLNTTSNSVRWMTLLLNSDLNYYANGWYGYDYMVSNDEGTMKLYAYDLEAREWKVIQEEVSYTLSGNMMMMRLKRSDVALQGETDFDFKWIDNVAKSTTDVLDFISTGECAPDFRFNYRYKGSQLDSNPVSLGALPTDDLDLSVDFCMTGATLSFNAASGGTVCLNFFDIMGHSLNSVRKQVPAGRTQLVASLPRGACIVCYDIAGKRGSKKFLVI